MISTQDSCDQPTTQQKGDWAQTQLSMVLSAAQPGVAFASQHAGSATAVSLSHSSSTMLSKDAQRCNAVSGCILEDTKRPLWPKQPYRIATAKQHSKCSERNKPHSEHSSIGSAHHFH